MTDGFLILAGLALLAAGAESLVRGASDLALRLNVSPALVGITVVAIGTSTPELFASIQAAVNDSPGIALGNIMGSNSFNIAFVLGATSLVYPLAVGGNTTRFEYPIMLLAAVQLHLLIRDRYLDRLEGGFLVLAMVTWTGYAVWFSRTSTIHAEQTQQETKSHVKTRGAPFCVGLIAAGVLILAAGSKLLVKGSVGIATTLGVPDAVVGLTIVAAGTSTPELATSLVAAFRKQADIAVGNIVGSNVFNILGIAGITALIHPLDVAAPLINRDSWWMIGFSLALFPLMKSGMRITRLEGGTLLCGFAVYMFALLFGSNYPG